MNTSRVVIVLLFTSFSMAWMPVPAAAREVNSAAELLPDTTVLYVEAAQIKEDVSRVLNHPMRERIESLTVFQQQDVAENLVRLRAAISLFEAGMSMRLPVAIETIGHGGIFFAIDGDSSGIAILAKSKDAETADKLMDVVLSVVRTSHKGAEPRSGTYRDYDAYEVAPELRMAVIDQWIILVNKPKLGMAIIDQYIDAGKSTLANSREFKRARMTRKPTASLWGFVDVATIRESGRARELYAGRSPNILAELLFGGLLSNLQHTNFATSCVEFSKAGLNIEILSPHQEAWAGEERQYFFGKAPQLLSANSQLFGFSAHRGLSEMWLRSGDLLTDNAAEDLAKADGQLSTFFSGKDFGEEVLGALGDEIQFVAARQDFSELALRPAIALPAFALQTRMKAPQETLPEMRRVFQSLVGFINVIGAMNGQPQLDLAWEELDGGQLVSATYVPDRDQRESQKAPINFNFSPTIAFQADRMILASSTALARELLQQRIDDCWESSSNNTHAQLQLGTLSQVLRDNRETIIADSILKKGKSRAAAAAETDLLLEVAAVAESIDLQLESLTDQLRLNLTLQLPLE